ncbi:hypothetical protein HYFRA_00003744 [Hymenoscyphus fraxineus]|uniref:Major facilitator superfamily (MFS) profile domain-containing protein n=1 Tax=Hymenoscyphus fraxineus TaxID=746836 RepID=A0A9N9PW94_9HELO|nr:hypothetical protein HYFRA_00003744 [Hymenoscyphus fraxineus]
MEPNSPPAETSPNEGTSHPQDWRFWAVFPGLCLASFLCALDSTILSTVLPTIVMELKSSWKSVWMINSYTLTFTAVQPIYGQSADLFGRKICIVTAILLFIIGSGICGGAKNTDMLIAGRAVQGLGGGGLSILPAMVVCDLVPLRERQQYTGIVYGAFAVGTFIGPVIGGVMADHIGWRWVFWLNLPVGGLALGLVVAFLWLNVAHAEDESTTAWTWKQVARIDYLGCIFMMGAVTSILIAISGTGSTSMGPRIDWGSWETLVPLLLGILALPCFLFLESFSSNPMTPLRLFASRTSTLAYFLTFLHGILLYWASYFLPVYFQAVKGASPQQSGINTLAGAIPMVPFGILGGFIIARTGHYRLNQLFGFGLAALAIGCFSILDQHSSTSTWVLLQIVLAMGAGIVLTALLPAIQAPLAESDVASATATWGLVQSLGFLCGVAMPSSIFENRFLAIINRIADVNVRDELRLGGAYAHASNAYISSLDSRTQSEVIGIFVASLRLVWEIGAGIAVLGFAASLFLKEVELRETLETEYGYKGKSEQLI